MTNVLIFLQNIIANYNGQTNLQMYICMYVLRGENKKEKKC